MNIGIIERLDKIAMKSYKSFSNEREKSS